MIERIEGAPEGVLAFRAVGKVEAADYEEVLTPAIDAAIADHQKVRLVDVLGPEYDGYSAAASREDLKLGATHLAKWERCAVVTDHRLIGDAIRAFAMLMSGEIKLFPVVELDNALSWAAR